MKVPFAVAAVISLLLVPCRDALSQTSNEERDLSLVFGDADFISLATGNRQPIAKAPAVATVITADDIKAMGATSLDQVLETIPGFHISLSSLRFSPIYAVRGIYTDINPQILVLIDGTPMTQLFAGDRGIRSTLPVTNIDRIEVIRGPGSAVYGADAFTGVINIITKRAKDIDGTELGLRTGSFDTKNAWILHGGSWSDVDIAFSLEWSHTEGDDRRIINADAQTLFDRALGTNASFAPAPAATRQERIDVHLDLQRDRWRLHLWNWHQYDSGVGPGVALALDPTGKATINNYLISLKHDHSGVTNNWDITEELSYMEINTKTEQKLFPPGTVLPIGSDGNIDLFSPAGIVEFPDGLIGNPDILEHHYRGSINGFYSGFNRHLLRIGIGFTYAKLDARETKNFGPGVIDGTTSPVDGALTDVTGTRFIFIRPQDRTNSYGFIQDEWSFAPDWDATIGIRYDHYSDFGDTVNPRAALVWQTRFDLTSKLLYGRAFRAPSFAELFSTNNPIRVGNPNLKPETIDTVELAFDYQVKFDLTTRLALFIYKIDDQISAIAGAEGASFTFENTGEQRGQGFELEFNWRSTPTLLFRGNYAYQDITRNSTTNTAVGAPHHQIYLGADWRITERWNLFTQLKSIIDRDRYVADTRPAIKDYTLVDVALRRSRSNNPWEFAVAARNLFNKKVYEPSPFVPSAAPITNDFPLERRNFYGEVRYAF